jgi:chloramphenicol O-acetyltransferase type A
MAAYLDTTTWARRDAFEFFRRFDKPYFHVCVRLDVARLKAALVARGGGGLSLACYFLSLRLANVHEPFRLRLENGRVRVHEVVHGSTTVLRDDGESFFFAEFDHTADFAAFVAQAGAAIDAARTMRATFEPKPGDVKYTRANGPKTGRARTRFRASHSDVHRPRQVRCGCRCRSRCITR